MRGLKVRSADILQDWSAALLADTSPGSIRDYIDTKNLLSLSVTGGTMEGPLLLADNALNPLAATPLRQVQELITTAVNSLIGAAPATLDTLQEIAAALSNNPNTIGAITTQLTDKASLTTGATFTGPVNVPTVTGGDSSSAAASTAWVLANTQAITPALTNFVNLSASGYVSKTVTGYVARTIVGSNGRVNVVNGNGIDGNTTIDLATSGVVAGNYPKVVVDSFGRVVAGVALDVLDLPLITPMAGSVFTGTPVNIINAVNSLQAAIAAAAGAADGAEDVWVGNGVQTTFNFTNINGSLAATRQNRILVFTDGNRQPKLSYSINVLGITFESPPSPGMEIEALQIA